MNVSYADGSLLAFWYGSWLVVAGFGASLVLAVVVTSRNKWSGGGLLVNTTMILAVLAASPLAMIRIGLNVAVTNHDDMGYISLVGTAVALALGLATVMKPYASRRLRLRGGEAAVEEGEAADGYGAGMDVTLMQGDTPIPDNGALGLPGLTGHVSEFFAPHVVGRDYETAAELNERLAVFKGNSFAKAAIEICWWTLQREITGAPLHRLLGGESHEVSAGADFGIQDSIDMLLGNIQRAVDGGFPRIKLKVARGWDLDMLRVVTSTFPDMTFHIDCNSGYSLDDLEFFKAIDGMGLAFIEQPLCYADILDHAELARHIETPICLDESAYSVKAVEQAIQVGACEYVNIKPGRIGSLANAIAVHDLCQNEGIPVWIGGMLESALGGALCVELATLPNFTYPGDLFPSSRFYTQDLSDPPLELTPGKTFEPFDGPLPAPVPARLEKVTVRSKSVVAPGG